MAVKKRKGVQAGPRTCPPSTCRNSAKSSWRSSSAMKPASRSRRTPTSSSRSRSARCFVSWMGKRAVDYRKQFKITPDMANGTAVNVCTMVFGNMGSDQRHRRGLHPQSGHRRERDLRRIPGQRPGRGRGGGHPHAQADRRTWNRKCRRSTASWWTCTTAWSRITTRCRISSSPSRTARSTACRPATAR